MSHGMEMINYKIEFVLSYGINVVIIGDRAMQKMDKLRPTLIYIRSNGIGKFKHRTIYC